MTGDLKRTWAITHPEHILIGKPCEKCGKPFQRYDRLRTGSREHFKCRSPQYKVEKPNRKPYRPREGDIVRFRGRKQLVGPSLPSKVRLTPVRKVWQTGEWKPVSRAFWHPVEEIRKWAEYLERKGA